MRSLINYLSRVLISISFYFFNILIFLQKKMTIIHYQKKQVILRKKLTIQNQEIHPYDTYTQKNIENFYHNHQGEKYFALTSGTTNKPKKIFYSQKRLAMNKWCYSSSMITMLGFKFYLKTFFIFSSLKKDSSLTSLLTKEKNQLNHFEYLQAPYRILDSPLFQSLSQKYGYTSIRLWLIALSNPRAFYATNPSSLVHFLEEIKNNWNTVKLFTVDFLQKNLNDIEELSLLANKVKDYGSTQRLESIKNSPSPIELSIINPALKSIICWDGGYVGVFLDKLKKLISPNINFYPMFSMSTEVIETLPFKRNNHLYLLPIAPGVLYEFIERNKDISQANILNAWELVQGKEYIMIVSDSYGLKRYNTQDLFLCQDTYLGLPHLLFRKRINLSFSFTGEKITGEQITLLFNRVREIFFPKNQKKLFTMPFMTTIPVKPLEGKPYYKILIVSELEDFKNKEFLAKVQNFINKEFFKINFEYAEKVSSKRLGPFKVANIKKQVFLKRMLDERVDSWESQFKFLPLYKKIWEE